MLLKKMKSIKTIKKEAIKAAQLSFRQDKLDEGAARQFVKTFKKLPLNEAVLSLNYYLRALKTELSKTTMVVESAIKIGESEIKDLKAGLGKQVKVLQVEQKINPSILGGVKVRIGDVIFDNSVRSRINQVKEALISG